MSLGHSRGTFPRISQNWNTKTFQVQACEGDARFREQYTNLALKKPTDASALPLLGLTSPVVFKLRFGFVEHRTASFQIPPSRRPTSLLPEVKLSEQRRLLLLMMRRRQQRWIVRQLWRCECIW